MGSGAVMDENMQKDEMASTAFSQSSHEDGNRHGQVRKDGQEEYE